MESSSDIKLPDMNVPSNLEFYRQIIDFENDTGRHELILGNLDRSQQRAVQSLAHSRNFDYEYQQGYARVLRGSTTNWNIEAMVENSPTEIAHYDEPIDSGRLLDEPFPFEMDFLDSNSEVEPWLQNSMYPYPPELPSQLARNDVASEGLPLSQPGIGSQLDMPGDDIYGNPPGLNGKDVDCNTRLSEETTPANPSGPMFSPGGSMFSSKNSSYDLIQQNIRRRAYVCKACQKSHSLEIDLIMHRRSRLSGNGIKCPGCTGHFTTCDLLLRHQREAHANISPSTADISRPSAEGFKSSSHASSTWSDHDSMEASLPDELFLTTKPSYIPESDSSRWNSRTNPFNSSTLSSPIRPFRTTSFNSPFDRFDMQGLPNSTSRSRSGSVSSLQSEHGRNQITQTSRNSSGRRYNSLRSQTMDATCDSPSRYASSGRSGRSRPLTSFARIGVNAIKMIGWACWRCRILGKKCTEDNPCHTCPKGNKAGKSSWTKIGCRRGTLPQEMESIDLCPKSISQPKSSDIDILCPYCRLNWYQSSNSRESKCSRCERIDAKVIGPFPSDLKILRMEEAAKRRHKDVINVTEMGEGDDNTKFSSAIATLRKNLLLENLGLPSHFPLSAGVYLPKSISMPSLIALDQCIIAIIWEITEDSSHIQSLSTFCGSSERPLNDLSVLLRSASIYQAKLEPDSHKLIAQSLICLREALELKRATKLGASHEFSHRKCHQLEDLILTDLIIDNIPSAKTSQDVIKLMIDIKLPVPRAFNYQFDNGVFRGRASAKFVNNREARQVIDALHKFKIDGQALQVEYKNSIPRPGERGSFCNDKNVDSLMSAIKRYIEQLSKVFFKKENLRGKTWWLSVFYSLVIQSLVRAILKAIVADGGVEIPSSINQYLHLAVRLFVATSGAHDPLVHGIPVQGDRLKALVACDSCKRRKLKCTRWKPFCEAYQAFQCPCVYGGKLEINDSEMEDYNFARLSVQQAEWQSSGLNSSGEYLQHMFQDDGQPITYGAAINN